MSTPAHHNALHPVEVATAGLTIRGFSISGLATWFVIPELDVMFDAGECPVEAIGVNNVFLSHGHPDHSNGLLRHWQLRQMMGMGKATYFVPAGTIDGLGARVRAEALLGAEEEPVFAEHFPQMVVVPTDRSRGKFKRGLWIEAFPVEHRSPSVGYTVGRTVQKLKPDFVGLRGDEIGTLRRNGTVVTDEVSTPLVTFIGDCTGASLAANKHIFDSKVVIIECTHVDDDQQERTAKYGHTHLRDIVAVLSSFDPPEACEAVILKHFSLKEHPDHIRERVTALTPPAWASRVKVFLP